MPSVRGSQGHVKLGSPAWLTRRLVTLPFHLQQRFLALETPAVAAHGAVLANHAMAWDCDRYRVCGTSAGNGAARAGLANGLGDLAVGPRDSEGNRLQICPNAPLKSSRADVQRQG